jgi:S-adenosylmethionine-dependent methyltransferase
VKAQETVRLALAQHVFTDTAWLRTEAGKADLDAHLNGRVEHNRNVVVPWLNSSLKLNGSSVLEIGCGTGASTQALAEAGCRLTAIDIDRPSLEVASARCTAHGLSVDLVEGNATQIGSLGQAFDHVLFYATLEHMTHEERLASLRVAWDMIPSGGSLCVIETPNRLWVCDDHTAQLPFFHWLLDDLAFTYASFSDRRGFREVYDQDTPERRLHFLRRGRGVSFHEFEIAIARDIQEHVASNLHELTRASTGSTEGWRQSPEGIFRALLQHFAPQANEAFLEPQLDLVMRKP